VKAAPKKAPVSKATKAIAKISASIAKLTERKVKINAEINGLRDQRTALKANPVVVAKAAPKAVTVAKKATMPATKK
jgi:cell division protein FtsB